MMKKRTLMLRQHSRGQGAPVKTRPGLSYEKEDKVLLLKKRSTGALMKRIGTGL
jgi:hypothetical protein